MSSPVHAGKLAAAFTIDTDSTSDAQARCVVRDAWPTAAYYGAWYFIPAQASSSNNWNLFHFQGWNGAERRNLWDVSIKPGADGKLHAYLFDFLRMTTREAANAPPIPIGSWFHLEVYWVRSADATGEFTLYQDNVRVFRLINLATDDTDLGEWFVGNLAVSLTPSASTVYVDDVSIRETR